jgi:hypothetical protein
MRRYAPGKKTASNGRRNMDTFQESLLEASLRSGSCPDNSEIAVQILRNPQRVQFYCILDNLTGNKG